MSQQMVEQELEFFQIPSPFKQPLRTGETLYEKLRAVKERFAREHRAKFEGTYVRGDIDNVILLIDNRSLSGITS
jgi:hypothetical protein